MQASYHNWACDKSVTPLAGISKFLPIIIFTVQMSFLLKVPIGKADFTHKTSGKIRQTS